MIETLLFIFHFKFENLNFKYSWLLNDMRIRNVDSLLSQKSLFNFCLPRKFIAIPHDWFQDSLRIPKYEMLKSVILNSIEQCIQLTLYSRILNQGSVLICGGLNLCMWNCGIWRTDWLYLLKKNVHVSGTVHFKAVLFKGQL